MLPYVAAPLVWAGHFLAVYAAESLFCSRGTAAGHFLLVVVATLAALGLLARPLLRGPGGAFDQRVQFSLAVLSLIAIAWSVLAAVMLPACS